MAAQGEMVAPGETRGLRGTWDLRISARGADHRTTEMAAMGGLLEAALAVLGLTLVQIPAAAEVVAVERASLIAGALEEPRAPEVGEIPEGGVAVPGQQHRTAAQPFRLENEAQRVVRQTLLKVVAAVVVGLSVTWVGVAAEVVVVETPVTLEGPETPGAQQTPQRLTVWQLPPAHRTR